jgi:hypothetical protein
MSPTRAQPGPRIEVSPGVRGHITTDQPAHVPPSHPVRNPNNIPLDNPTGTSKHSSGQNGRKQRGRSQAAPLGRRRPVDGASTLALGASLPRVVDPLVERGSALPNHSGPQPLCRRCPASVTGRRPA